MVDSGNLMGVVTTGAGIVIMTGVACHTMRMVDRSMGGGGGMNRSRGYTSYRRTPTRSRTTSTRRSTPSRRRR